MIRSSGAGDWDELRSRFLDAWRRLPEDADERALDAEARSEVAQVYRTLVDAAIERGREEGLDPQSDVAVDRLEAAYDLASSLTFPFLLSFPFSDEDRRGMSADEVREKLRLRHPVDARYLVEAAGHIKPRSVDRDEFERAVGDYLSSEFRVAAIDRLLVQLLIEMEITAYLVETFQKNPIRGHSLVEQIALTRPGRIFWRGLGSIFIGCAIVSAVIVVLAEGGVLSPNTSFLLLAGTLLLFIALSLWLLVSCWRARPKWRHARAMVHDMVDGMRLIYEEARAPGPISLIRLRKSLEHLSERGAVWPSALWALLDDLDRRREIRI